VEGILAMHGRLSADSLRRRYLGASAPGREEISRISHLNPGQGQAFVALSPGPDAEIVGLAYYLVDRKQPDAAEPALLVEDDYQGLCIGTYMMVLMRRRAASQGIHRFDALVESGNSPMLRLLLHSGELLQSLVAYGAHELSISLAA